MVLFHAFTSIAHSIITIHVEKPRDRGWYPGEGKDVYFVLKYSRLALEHI
jgi:hypothetical protein